MHTPSISRMYLLLVVTLAVSGLLAGCVSLGSQQTTLPTEEAVEQTVDELDTVEATIVSSLDGTAISKHQTVFEFGTERRRARTQASGSETLVVANESVTWRYDRAANTVRLTHHGADSGGRNTTEYAKVLQSMFGRLSANGDDANADGVLNPLILPSTGSSGQPYAGVLEQFTDASLSYAGTEAVDGRETFVVEIVPGGDTQASNMTMWLDQEWYHPIQWQATISGENGPQTVTTTLRNVTFNPEIPAGTFTFEPPANATIVERTVTSQSFDSRADLAAASEMTIPEPSVPDSLAFDSGRRFNDNGTVRTSLQYTNETATLRVTKADPRGDIETLTEGERLEINGQQAIGQTFDSGTSLRWSCGGYRYSVFGDISGETARAVGESIDCG
ncbi:outer membrane lipoprotein-sorting protein [Halorhabdus sp. CUG00001]|uniref:outer membrane lipoprotein-sorting protein n=1 Tax=Halorhabdus sp. CUG00001 TaxID=2600297 RepID=UPI001E3C8258|nr:DUF2092 domain-containing protein [Halorhabdus sp. CUG00001]